MDDKKKKVLVILGNAGSGKTLFCNRLSRNLLMTYNDYLPLYGYLPMQKSKVENEFAELCLRDFRVDSNSDIVGYRNLLFIMDAFDEIQEDYKINLIESNKLLSRFPNSKVVITCRTHEVFDMNNFVPFRGSTPLIKKRTILYVQPFGKNKIQEYVYKLSQDPNKACLLYTSPSPRDS